MNSDRTLKLKSLPIRRLDIALLCCWYRVTATVCVALRAVVTVVVAVAGVADVGAGVRSQLMQLLFKLLQCGPPLTQPHSVICEREGGVTANVELCNTALQ